MSTDEKPFLERWSRLKQAAREQPRREAEVHGGDASAQDDQKTPEPEKVPGDEVPPLPSIESLTADSDYTVFMREGVPEELRQRALRKLWLTDAVFTAPDVLDVYALDYANTPSFPGGVKTLFQVGMGMIDPDQPKQPEAASPSPPDDTPPATPDAAANDATGSRNPAPESTSSEPTDGGISADTADKNKPV